MKKSIFFIIGIFCILGLTACQKASAGPLDAANEKDSAFIAMKLDENYDECDPFINEQLFCVTEDLKKVNVALFFRMEGKNGIVEIKDNSTEEVLWSKTWEEDKTGETLEFSLENLQKGKEYAVSFTGTEIKYAVITADFDSDLVSYLERPSKK